MSACRDLQCAACHLVIELIDDSFDGGRGDRPLQRLHVDRLGPVDRGHLSQRHVDRTDDRVAHGRVSSQAPGGASGLSTNARTPTCASAARSRSAVALSGAACTMKTSTPTEPEDRISPRVPECRGARVDGRGTAVAEPGSALVEASSLSVTLVPEAPMRDAAAERSEIDRAIEGKTLCSAFAETVARRGDAEALVGKARDGTTRSYSWNQVRDRVREVALGLHALGVAPGSFGVIMGRNRPEYVIADLGAVHAGATPVGLYNTLAPEQVSYIANHCDARVAIVEDAGFLAKFQAVRAELPKLERIVLLEGDSDDPSVTTWDQLLATGRAEHARDPQAFDRLWQAVKPDDVLTLIYTSGTTGPPKGVIDTHRTALWVLESMRRAAPPDDDDRVISYLPLAHAADRFLIYYATMVSGNTAVFCSEVTQILQTMIEVRPTSFGGVPRIWEKLHAGLTSAITNEPDEPRRRMVLGALEVGRAVVALEQRGEPVPAALAQQRAMVEPIFAAIRARIGLDRARYTVTGAAPTPREVLEFFHAIGIRIADVWGMSEIAVVGSRNPAERIKIGSIGTALPGVELRLAPDGELQVRGGMVMRGYYKDPQKTAETIDQDGWLSTGDIAKVDADGYYTIVDRKKELIITAGGKNISPSNLESLLKAHPLIGQACVIGDNRAYLTALIVLDGQVAPAWAAAHGIATPAIAELAAHPEVQADIARAVAAVNEHVSRVESIRKWTILPTEWTAESEELTPTLKLKRRVIHDKYVKAIAAMYGGVDDPLDASAAP
jgi:long-chain acyl-CoA synthetase